MKPLSLTEKFAAALLSVFLLWSLVYKSMKTGVLGQIGPDNDDKMRLLQIRDYLEGQSWFDVSQMRMGLGSGTDMHWSRLPDIPVIILTRIFDIFLPSETALIWAYSLWPPLTILLLAGGLLVGARYFGPSKTLIFTMVLTALTFFGHFKFLPGALDHHNLQMGLLAIGLGFALDPAMRARSFAISGMALALSVAIGVEVYLFVAVFCAFFALNWFWVGKPARRGTEAMGISFAVSLALIFILTTAPGQYSRIYCDSLSLVTLIAGIGGGAALALSARWTSHRPRIWRAGALAIIGLFCLGCLGIGAPQCLSNPLDTMPPELTTFWLDHVTETESIFSSYYHPVLDRLFILGTPLLAMILCLWQIARRKNVSVNLLLLALLLTAIIMMIYQGRFLIFGPLLALLPLAAWLGRLYQAGRDKDGLNLRPFLALPLAIPFIWMIPGIIYIMGQSPENRIAVPKPIKADCYSEDVMAQLKALPTGRFAALFNSGTALLSYTDHSVLAGNYHRNIDGNLAVINIFRADQNEAQALLRAAGADYIYLCRPVKETQDFLTQAPEGLLASLVAGDVPDYLERISEDVSQGEVTFYRVKAD